MRRWRSGLIARVGQAFQPVLVTGPDPCLSLECVDEDRLESLSYARTRKASPSRSSGPPP